MAQWGASNLPVNVSNVTTIESSNGAPISAAVNAKWAADSPFVPVTAPNSDFGNTSPGSKALVDLNFFQNSTPNAFVNGMAIGVYGISANQTANAYMGAHTGWTLVKIGTGGRAGRIQTETLVAMHSIADPATSQLVVNVSDPLVTAPTDSANLLVGA